MSNRIVQHDPTTEGGHEPDAWVDAGVQAAYAFYRLKDAKTLGEQSTAFAALSEAMGTLQSWLPGVDDHGDMPWDRGDDEYYDRRDEQKAAAAKAAKDKAAKD